MAQPNHGYHCGDVVLVRFVFADERGAKRRPALVLNTAAYSASRQELVVAAMTSRSDRLLVGDCGLADWHSAGLPRASVVTGIFRTIKQSMVESVFGQVSAADLAAVQQGVRVVLGL